ncbi:MAG TPA: DNA polymerase III subunit gamma/tau [Thermoanaerobaculia bacterium]|jgi:DNA polymerase-3 subunit gamma/tau|nr:DNA polymerase III subunit gamma/tau [Thermoanaerobaculia bacterium]
MTYQVLARKWRPQNFSSLVGQEPIVTALRNALTEGRIAQAYLFSGIRGVGKTTAARVLAKALNCERGPAADPCNECRSCVDITRGSDLDVIEVDAATYSKVEQVRDLTESLKYGPAHNRYKVVVLDEIHRLSRQAFDALLKIVEEPPPHLVFIFATTEIDAVPATVLSRCQEFHFRRVPSLNLAAHLRNICAAEAIQASDTALRLIARAGEGSVRDSVALLDQLATFGSGTIADEDAVRLLGGLDTALFQMLIEGILGGDPHVVRNAVRRVEEEGWDPRHVYGQFLAFCRDALHLAMGGSPEQVDLPGEEAQALAATAKASGYENLLRLLNLLLTSEPLVRRSDSGALAVEIAWLRGAELPKLTRIEEILAGGGTGGGGRGEAFSSLARPAAAPRPAPSAPPPPPQVPPPVRRSAPEPAAAPAPPPRPAPPVAAPSRPSDPITAFREEAGKRKPNLGGGLGAVEDLRFENGRVSIICPNGDSYLRTRLEANRAILEEAASVVWGPETRVDIVESRSTPKAAAPAEAKPAGVQQVEQIPAVQAVLEIFPGSRVEAVEEQGSYTED